MKKFLQRLGVISILLILLGLLVWFLLPPVLESNTGLEDKDLWERLELIVIPLVLAIVAFLLNSAEKNNDRKLAVDLQQERALQNYIDRMAELLIKENLRNSKNSEIEEVARTRTLTVLSGLDKNRKAQVVRFLYAANLINKENNIIKLKDADLRYADLRFFSLSNVDLEGTDLRYANLSLANLSGSNLYNANLRYANLSRANLSDSELRGTDLRNANFFLTYMFLANIDGANLRRANLLLTNLHRVFYNSIKVSFFHYLYRPDIRKHNHKGTARRDL